MTLYHGTNADIDAIDLNRGLRHKDFGKGFYLTPDRTTAIRMAQKKARHQGAHVPPQPTAGNRARARVLGIDKVLERKNCSRMLRFVRREQLQRHTLYLGQRTLSPSLTYCQSVRID